MAAPMVFDAPGRLSTITCLPSESESLSPSKRATMSLGPPVVTGTTKRMLLAGHADWLCAASGATAIANDAAAIGLGGSIAAGGRALEHPPWRHILARRLDRAP